MAYKYFIYSKEQAAYKKDIINKQGRKFRLGNVVVKGIKRNISEINTTGRSRFSDSQIIAEGEESTFTFSPPAIY